MGSGARELFARSLEKAIAVAKYEVKLSLGGELSDQKYINPSIRVMEFNPYRKENCLITKGKNPIVGGQRPLNTSFQIMLVNGNRKYQPKYKIEKLR